MGGWGFSSVVECLPSKRKALGSVLSSGGKKKKIASWACDWSFGYFMGFFFFHPSPTLFFYSFNPLTLDRKGKKKQLKKKGSDNVVRLLPAD